MQLYCAFSLAQVYAHDPECRIFCLDLTADGRRLVERSVYAPMLEAYALELELEEREAAEEGIPVFS